MKRSKLLDELVDDLAPVAPQAVTAPWLAWLGGSVLFVLVAIHLAGPIRPDAMAQLLGAPRFALEMALGAAAALALSVAGFRAAVPGLLGSAGWRLALGLGGLWVLSLVVGLLYPALEPSMLGKRDHCVVETLLYGIPPMLLLLYWQRRMFALSPLRSAAMAGLAAGILPALYMQIACMYEPGHALKFHVAPAVVLAGLAAAMQYAGKTLLPGQS